VRVRNSGAHGISGRGIGRHDDAAQPPEVSITGRTSTPPYGAGHSLAISRA
jgi:hypothetical protein